ncbi:UNVERIFIED_ORG: integrase [Rhizobium esperanzae]|nr:DNA integration/recombination/inversion protein [Rhizobium etli CNPAF512]
MTKARSAFTTKWVEAVAATDKRQEIPDPSLKGFYLIIQPLPGGGKSWAVRYKGKPKFTIGSVGAWKLADARKEAGRIMRAYDEGGDPRAEKKELLSDDNLIENVLAQFVKRHVKRKNRDSTAQAQQRYIDKELIPRWKGKHVAAIRRRDIVTMLDDVVESGRPQAAVRLLALTRKFFNWAVGTGWLDASPCVGVPVPAPVVKRKRVLSDSELRWVWKGAEAIGWPFGPMVQLLILTGQRREEVAAASWPEFDLIGKEPGWTIPGGRAKNGNEQVVALAPTAVSILTSLPKVLGQSDFILSTNGDTSISGYSRGKRRLDEAMMKIARSEAEESGNDPDEVKLEPFTLHDLRRTLATRLGDLGVAPHTVEAILNHARVGVAAHYNHARYEKEKREALLRWERHIKKIISAGPVSNVISFGKVSLRESGE